MPMKLILELKIDNNLHQFINTMQDSAILGTDILILIILLKIQMYENKIFKFV